MEGDFEKLASHDKYYKSLIDLLKSRTHGKVVSSDIMKTIENVIAKKMTSKQVLDYLASKVTPENKRDDKYDKARKQARIRDIENYIGLLDKEKIETYLDIGCGDGKITSAIGHVLFGLEKKSIIGIDIESWAGHEHASSVDDSITFRKIAKPGVFPVESGTIDVITINMVLHHIPEQVFEQTMLEIHRCLKAGGTIFLREHDSPNHMVDSLINIEHGIFEVVLEQLSSGEKFQKSYYGKYKPRRDWVDMFIAFGFTPLGGIVARTDKTRPFTVAFQKSNKSGDRGILDKNASELRAAARNMGLKASNSLPVAAVKRAIVAGRRK